MWKIPKIYKNKEKKESVVCLKNIEEKPVSDSVLYVWISVNYTDLNKLQVFVTITSFVILKSSYSSVVSYKWLSVNMWNYFWNGGLIWMVFEDGIPMQCPVNLIVTPKPM